MAAAAHRYACQSCGATAPKWSGRCEACGEWNTIVEEVPREAAPKGLGRGAGRKIELVAIQQAGPEPPRIVTRIGELDRVFGGGLVEGSTVLVAGDPGIGKSTLLLQAAAALARDGRTCVYVSGEESAEQVRLRARRLGLGDAPVLFAAATSVRDVLATLDTSDRPDAVVVDSIQTMYVDSLDSAPGSVAQVRASAHELIRFAKRRGAVLFLVGHVTKDGQIAGPRVLEHMVDTVLYFEGELSHQFRILRAVKNRFGATDEIGVFEMTDSGLNEVPNPSALFLGERDRDASGAAVFAGVEGSRPVLVEIQALVAPSSLATPRRAVVGWDSARLAMVMAVLDARCGLALGGNDVYLNVAGGLRISEPAADLAVAAALVSSLTGTPVPANTVMFGEVGLSGEVRQVGQADVRLKEAAKLGFTKALIPRRKGSGKSAGAAPLEIAEVDRLSDLVDRLGGDHGRGA
ncbi:MAG: DNA repair protein RadA [Proteobacteria bacterium]|nr:DNA repair protein RadA [Pseudomonadota bacterium]